ncbi:hypothetical protein [Paenibacillus rigui]|uniref:DUF2642 domain-containing protein n=1 Tax=Paenibacillus rigui TaxID=554312 RepID=A0A229UQV5_9BACL|nr:hypothetical protein [Paenibacillus rigui]OXM85631.1 hypothetical protein CF651_14695 [Paenibacillus rigui]
MIDSTSRYLHKLQSRCKRWSIKWLLHRYLMEIITVVTSGGMVVGTLVAIGSDYIELLEPNGDRVLVPLDSLESFS